MTRLVEIGREGDNAQASNLSNPFIPQWRKVKGIEIDRYIDPHALKFRDQVTDIIVLTRQIDKHFVHHFLGDKVHHLLRLHDPYAWMGKIRIVHDGDTDQLPMIEIGRV